MPDLLGNPSLPNLLTQELKQVRDELDALDRNLAMLETKKAGLKLKVAAIETLLGRTPSGGDGAAEPTLADEIMAIMADGTARNPKYMRKDLIRRGVDPDRVSSSTGNFYNSIFRLVKRRKLTKEPGGKYVLGPAAKGAAS